MELRRATEADAQALAAIAAAAYSPYLERMEGLRPGPMDTDYASAVADTEAWVALHNGDVVGFVLLVGEVDHVLLENVAVVPEHHGRGVGRMLLELAEHRTAELGLDRVRLYTHVTMWRTRPSTSGSATSRRPGPPITASPGCSTRSISD